MSEDQIRKDFEEWMGDGGLSPRAIERNSKGDYILMQTAHAWEVWQAAQALNHAREMQPHPDTIRLQQAVWRLEDLLEDDDPQAWKEARKFLERLKKEQEMEAQQQADALDAQPAAPVVWPEPAGRIITGPHGLFVSYNSLIAATPGNLYTRAQVEAMLEAQGVKL